MQAAEEYEFIFATLGSDERGNTGELFPESPSASHKTLTSCDFPLPEKSLDLLISVNRLEELKMEDFYMLCAEARRVVKPGGYWAVGCLSLPSKSNFAKNFLAWLLLLGVRIKPKELTHYISPEDWEVRADLHYWRGFLPRQTLILKRTE